VKLYAGIDVGQSGTTAAIGDGERVIAYGRSGPGDEIAQDARSTRLRDAMHASLADAIANAQLPQQTQFDAIVAGISGYEGRIAGVPPALPSARVTLVHDAPIAHAAAFGDAPGIVVIAGTGSVAYARANDGRTHTTGGWGYLFGDEGSAFWIARTAFESAIACERECGSAIAAHFERSSLRETARAFYAGEISRSAFAALCERDHIHCVHAAALRACDELAHLARSAALDAFDATAVAFTGGLMRSQQIAQTACERTRSSMPGARVFVSAASAADGALLLASRA
jgi:N-acetylglucosamine kinase-like BadF-type ATPase